MPARSMVNQGLYLQKETSAGVAATSAMKRVLGIRGTPTWNVEGEDFKASGYKVNTSRVVNTEEGGLTLETIQDYNAWTWILCGGFGAPVSAPHGTATGAHVHTYDLNPKAQDAKATFTAMWGDAVQALQMTYVMFQSLGITVDRGGLSIDASAIGRAPVTGIALPGSGVTEIASIPVASRQWNLYCDDTWAGLGTTQILAPYQGGLTFGDKYVPDYVINRSQPSYTELVEAEDTEYSGSLLLGFDAAAVAMVNSFTNGTLKFFRFEAEGPNIGATSEPHSLILDFCARIINPTEPQAAPNSPSVVLGFDLQTTVDPISGKAASAVLTNGIASL